MGLLPDRLKCIMHLQFRHTVTSQQASLIIISVWRFSLCVSTQASSRRDMQVSGVRLFFLFVFCLSFKLPIGVSGCLCAREMPFPPTHPPKKVELEKWKIIDDWMTFVMYYVKLPGISIFFINKSE